MKFANIRALSSAFYVFYLKLFSAMTFIIQDSRSLWPGAIPLLLLNVFLKLGLCLPLHQYINLR